MSKKKLTLLLVLILVLLLGAASLLYKKLGDGFAPQQLSLQEAAAEAEAPAPTPSPTEENTESQEPPLNPAPSPTPSPTPPPAPDFTVYDADGNEVQLSEYFGKPIVLNFWASFCYPCALEMPHFQEKFLELGDEVHFLMINMTGDSRESVEKATEFLEENEYSFPVLYDLQSQAAYTYGVYTMPTTYFIDADGNAITRAIGVLDAETLQLGIDMIC